jgi:hypothetical protein
MKLFSKLFVSISSVSAVSVFAVDPKGVSALTMTLIGNFHVSQLLKVYSHRCNLTPLRFQGSTDDCLPSHPARDQVQGKS